MSVVIGANEDKAEVERGDPRDLGLVRGMMNQYFFSTKFSESPYIHDDAYSEEALCLWLWL